jgi:hypothetical protein
MMAGKTSIALFLWASVALLNAGDTTPKATGNATFDKLKALVGSWEGVVINDAGHKDRQEASFQLFADESALMSRLSGGMPHDMVTIFHMDGSDVMLTHYCAMHNQPRMVLAPGGDANKLVFKFKDGTNIEPGVGHMNRLVFILDGPNHHIEEWTYLKDGQETTARSDFHRKL